jgi:hypothetical protein
LIIEVFKKELKTFKLKNYTNIVNARSRCPQLTHLGPEQHLFLGKKEGSAFGSLKQNNNKILEHIFKENITKNLVKKHD